MDIGRLLWKYAFIRGCVYAGSWMTMFLLLMLIMALSPKTALWLLKLVEPLSKALGDLFWMFVPESGQFIRKGGELIGRLASKVTSRMSEQNQAILQLAVLNGILLVTIAAWIAQFIAMYFVKRALIREFLRKHEVWERTYDLPQTHFDRREPTFEWPKV